MTAALSPIIISPQKHLWSFPALSRVVDDSHDYWSQNSHSAAADAADVFNLCLDLIAGAAGLLNMNAVWKMAPNQTETRLPNAVMALT